jgi:hypothetical protein
MMERLSHEQGRLQFLEERAWLVGGFFFFSPFSFTRLSIHFAWLRLGVLIMLQKTCTGSGGFPSYNLRPCTVYYGIIRKLYLDWNGDGGNLYEPRGMGGMDDENCDEFLFVLLRAYCMAKMMGSLVFVSFQRGEIYSLATTIFEISHPSSVQIANALC